MWRHLNWSLLWYCKLCSRKVFWNFGCDCRRSKFMVLFCWHFMKVRMLISKKCVYKKVFYIWCLKYFSIWNIAEKYSFTSMQKYLSYLWCEITSKTNQKFEKLWRRWGKYPLLERTNPTMNPLHLMIAQIPYGQDGCFRLTRKEVTPVKNKIPASHGSWGLVYLPLKIEIIAIDDLSTWSQDNYQSTTWKIKKLYIFVKVVG